MECLAQLTQQAIDHSSEIEAINQQLELTAERQDYAESRQWTNYLTLDPIRLVQNVLGGGDVQRDRLAIANLELETANLIRRREEVAEEIANDVLDAVLDHQSLKLEGRMLATRLDTQRQRQMVTEAKYRTGQSSTDAMLRVWQRTEDMAARCEENIIQHQRVIEELYALVGAVNRVGTVINDGSCVWRYAANPVFRVEEE
ncbi:hypothetical protein QGP82_22075 [Leptothoe sp. LEGE 181152]|nr:hypothetical protein [Leptothoe sp. LEGE 181152]